MDRPFLLMVWSSLLTVGLSYLRKIGLVLVTYGCNAVWSFLLSLMVENRFGLFRLQFPRPEIGFGLFDLRFPRRK